MSAVKIRVFARSRSVEKNMLKYFMFSHDRIVKLVGCADITNLIDACTGWLSRAFHPKMSASRARTIRDPAPA
jgi:hypothetical protein